MSVSVLRVKDTNGNIIEIPAIKGDKGADGKDAVIDQTYNPESENAQSGRAVAEAIGNIDLALDNIIAIQNSLIGGDNV